MDLSPYTVVKHAEGCSCPNGSAPASDRGVLELLFFASVFVSVSVAVALPPSLYKLAAVACFFLCWKFLSVLEIVRDAQVGQTKTVFGKCNRHRLIVMG